MKNEASLSVEPQRHWEGRGGRDDVRTDGYVLVCEDAFEFVPHTGDGLPVSIFCSGSK